MQEIDRREALKHLSMLVGGTLSASSISAILSGCGTEQAPTPYVFATLQHEQRDLINAVAEAIIPTTDTPGAGKVGIDRFFDRIVSSWMQPAEKDRFLAGLSNFSKEFERGHGRQFSEASPSEQLAFMRPIDDEAAEARHAELESLPFFATMKELTIIGYYTSETGAARELRHQMVFDSYQGDLDFREGDRAWS
jgi:hypothetical protein